MALTVLIAFMLSLGFIQGKIEIGPQLEYRPDNLTYFDVYASALSKAHYNPWACSYRDEPGYKCLSCKSALHCYPGNFALLVQCAGLFPYCRNGYCSRFKTDGCIEDNNSHTVSHITVAPTTHKVNKTSPVPDVTVSEENTHTEMSLPDGEESASNAVTTELNDPNKVIVPSADVEASSTPNIIETARTWKQLSNKMVLLRDNF